MKIPAPWSPARGQSLLALTVLLVATLLPYPALLTFDAVHVPDDVFVSDLFGGELPQRVSVGRMLRAGSLPTWEPSLYGGMPLMGADPIGILCFGLIARPAAALDAFRSSCSSGRRWAATRSRAGWARLARAPCWPASRGLTPA
nr:hypothetical protein [Deltaproteobacteria bacterium]